MRKKTPKQIEAILGLDGIGRFKHFVKRVVDDEVAWGLWEAGWALMSDNAGQEVFPLWPAREYAELCGVDQWGNYKPKEIPLSYLLNDLLPKLSRQGILPGIFPTPAGQGVTTTIKELTDSLQLENRRYQ